MYHNNFMISTRTLHSHSYSFPLIHCCMQTLKKVNTITQHTKLVHHLAVIHDSTSNSTSPSSGKTMWSCSSDNTICVWDIVSYLLFFPPIFSFVFIFDTSYTTARLLTQINTRVRGLKVRTQDPILYFSLIKLSDSRLWS